MNARTILAAAGIVAVVAYLVRRNTSDPSFNALLGGDPPKLGIDVLVKEPKGEPQPAFPYAAPNVTDYVVPSSTFALGDALLPKTPETFAEIESVYKRELNQS